MPARGEKFPSAHERRGPIRESPALSRTHTEAGDNHGAWLHLHGGRPE
jgi:hypothetical protein